MPANDRWGVRAMMNGASSPDEGVMLAIMIKGPTVAADLSQEQGRQLRFIEVKQDANGAWGWRLRDDSNRDQWVACYDAPTTPSPRVRTTRSEPETPRPVARRRIDEVGAILEPLGFQLFEAGGERLWHHESSVLTGLRSIPHLNKPLVVVSEKLPLPSILAGKIHLMDIDPSAKRWWRIDCLPHLGPNLRYNGCYHALVLNAESQSESMPWWARAIDGDGPASSIAALSSWRSLWLAISHGNKIAIFTRPAIGIDSADKQFYAGSHVFLKDGPQFPNVFSSDGDLLSTLGCSAPHAAGSGGSICAGNAATGMSDNDPKVWVNTAMAFVHSAQVSDTWGRRVRNAGMPELLARRKREGVV